MQTYDGIITRGSREDISLAFKEFTHSQSWRSSNNQPFGIFKIELSNTV